MNMQCLAHCNPHYILFSLYIANIENIHAGETELFKCGAISVARSMISGTRCDVDKTMEETFMKIAKSNAGAAESGAGHFGILGNYESYQ